MSSSPLDDFEYSAADKEKWSASIAAMEEQRIVSAILKHYKDAHFIAAIRSYSEEKVGRKEVNLHWFCDLFNTFPIKLFHSGAKILQPIKLDKLLNSALFTKSKLYENFENAKLEATAQGLEGMPVGVTHSSPMLIVHNYGPDFSEGSSAIVLNVKDECICIETLKSLLGRLSWFPA